MRKHLWRTILLMILALGFIFGDVNLNFGTDSSRASAKTIEKQLDNLQNISGYFFYSPGKSLTKKLTAFQSAKTKLDLRTYEFTNKEFKSVLEDLASNGVNIRIIIEDNKYRQFKNTFRVLSQYFSGYSNIQLKSDRQMGTEYVHAKVNLIDSGVIIQTANLTKSAFKSNREHFFKTTDSGVLTSLHTIFEKDRNGDSITMKDIHPNLVVCNINCRGVIEQLLQSAEESIIIQTQYILDDRLRNILKSKKTLPEFKLLVADTSNNDDLIRYFGSGYARKFKKYYNHTKMILVDHEILLLGSMNLSQNSLDNNREIGILLLDTAIIDEFSAQFYKDWKTI